MAPSTTRQGPKRRRGKACRGNMSVTRRGLTRRQTLRNCYVLFGRTAAVAGSMTYYWRYLQSPGWALCCLFYPWSNQCDSPLLSFAHSARAGSFVGPRGGLDARGAQRERMGNNCTWVHNQRSLTGRPATAPRRETKSPFSLQKKRSRTEAPSVTALCALPRRRPAPSPLSCLVVCLFVLGACAPGQTPCSIGNCGQTAHHG